ncbi:MAG: carboxypeptidase regulatory-like domain-containing protein [Coriobacteriia bacterium]|nr:carboxypeptidase regulatory-like domain-containing protein [Coriobacteriia bacterium]
MRRIIARVALAAALVVALTIPLAAQATPALPTPADGERVALDAVMGPAYQHAGTWYCDGVVMTGDQYLAGVAVVRPVVTIEYRTAENAFVSTQTVPVPCGVLNVYDTVIGGYYTFFHFIQNVPDGAEESKTTLAANDVPGEPGFPSRHYGIAASNAVRQAWGQNEGLSLGRTPDSEIDTTTLSSGRPTYEVWMTNNTTHTVGPLYVVGNEVQGPSSMNVAPLDTLEMQADDPEKSARLLPGETTTFTVQGLNSMLAPGNQRFYHWNLWIEAEPMPALVGTVTCGGRALSGAHVEVSGRPMAHTNASGRYGVLDVTPGIRYVGYSKPGFHSRTVEVAMLPGVDASRDVTLTTTPKFSWVNPTSVQKTYSRKRGKATYTLSATVKGDDNAPVQWIKVYLQVRKPGSSTWTNVGGYKTSTSTGKVTRTFTSTVKSTRYYRWALKSGQAGVIGSAKSSQRKVIVR